MIAITPKAIAYIETLVDKNYRNGFVPYLRLSVLGGGCSGLSYKLDWENNLEPNNICYPQEKFTLVVDTRSHLFIENLTLDYSDGLNGTGFVYINSAAKRVCGCGNSFST